VSAQPDPLTSDTVDRQSRVAVPLYMGAEFTKRFAVTASRSSHGVEPGD
jgi:hypothetical protein